MLSANDDWMRMQDAEASNSVFAYPEVPAGIAETETLTTEPVELHWLGEGHLQPQDVSGTRYAVVLGWFGAEGEAPEQMEAAAAGPPTVATVRFLSAVDRDAAETLEATAGRVCTAQAEGAGRATLRLASLHRRCGVGDPTPTEGSPQYVWVTVERAPAGPPLELPEGVAEVGLGPVVLCRGAAPGLAAAGAAAVAEWASGYLPSWPVI